jgi:hypothetical protein
MSEDGEQENRMRSMLVLSWKVPIDGLGRAGLRGSDARRRWLFARRDARPQIYRGSRAATRRGRCASRTAGGGRRTSTFSSDRLIPPSSPARHTDLQQPPPAQLQAQRVRAALPTLRMKALASSGDRRGQESVRLCRQTYDFKLVREPRLNRPGRTSPTPYRII